MFRHIFSHIKFTLPLNLQKLNLNRMHLRINNKIFRDPLITFTNLYSVRIDLIFPLRVTN